MLKCVSIMKNYTKIYLRSAILEDGSKGLKIGCSRDAYYQRNGSYRQNDLGNIICAILGDFVDEKAIQLYFSNYLSHGEIFVYSDYIIDKFEEFSNNGLEEVYDEVWKNRRNLFCVRNDFKKNTTKYEVLCRSIKSQGEIDLTTLPTDTVFDRELIIFIKTSNPYIC